MSLHFLSILGIAILMSKLFCFTFRSSHMRAYQEVVDATQKLQGSLKNLIAKRISELSKETLSQGNYEYT